MSETRYVIVPVTDPDARYVAPFTVEQIQPMRHPSQPPGECSVRLNERWFTPIPENDTLREDIEGVLMTAQEAALEAGEEGYDTLERIGRLRAYFGLEETE